MLTQEQFSQLRKQGLSVEQIASFEKGEMPKQQEGFLSKIFRAVTEPVVTLAARPIQAGMMLAGKEAKDASINLPYYGEIKAPTGSFGNGGEMDILKDVGRGVETVALGLGTGGLAAGEKIFGKSVASIVPKIFQTPGIAGVAKTGLKGLVGQGIKEGIKTGATVGGLSSFGQALQEAEVQPANVAYKTLFGAATGGATGGVLGAIAPIAVKTISGIKKFTNIGELNKALEESNNIILRPPVSTTTKWAEQKVNPIKSYTEIFGKNIPQVDKNNRFIKESVKEFADKVDQIYQPSSAAFNTILRNSPEVNNLAKMESQAIGNISKSSLTSSQKIQATNKIQNEFLAMRSELKNQILGQDNIPVSLTDNLKDRYWGATKYFGPEESTVTNESNRAIGRTFAKNIEDSITDVGVKNYNKQLQELIVLKKYIGSLNGKLSGTGGKMTRLMARVAGSVAGSGGGPIGSITGAITGDKIAQVLINPAYSPQRWLLFKQLEKLPAAERQTLVQQADEVLQKMFNKRMETLALPAPSGKALGVSLNAGKPIPVLPPRTNKEILGTRELFAGGRYVPPKTTKLKIPVQNMEIDQTGKIVGNYIPPENLKAEIYRLANEIAKKRKR